jgi:hypothetical protein
VPTEEGGVSLTNDALRSSAHPIEMTGHFAEAEKLKAIIQDKLKKVIVNG